MASIFDDIRRQKKMRAAEGLLDLIMVFADRWLPTAANRDRVARRALAVLADFQPGDRHYGHVQYLRGQAYRAMEQFAAAIRPLEDAAAAEDNIHTYLALGWCYKRVERLDLAIEALERALEQAPCEAIIHYTLACYWALVGNKDRAIDYLAQSFEIDPDYRDLVANESDFDGIRDDPDFRMATSVIV